MDISNHFSVKNSSFQCNFSIALQRVKFIEGFDQTHHKGRVNYFSYNSVSKTK